MKSEQLLLALILIVVGFLGWQTYQQVTGRQSLPTAVATAAGSKAAAATIAKPATERPAPPPGGLPQEVAPTELDYTAEQLRDPFVSLLPQEVSADSSPKALPSLRLQGLMYGSVRPRAIIEGKVVKEGDHVGEVEVVQILRDGVLLTYQNRRFFLRSGPAPR